VSANVARDLIVDICRSLAAHGPRRFYVLNTGVSTAGPLRASQALLKLENIEMAFTDIIGVAAAVVKGVTQQEAGTHADEIETSMMLYIAPETVNMAKASKDYPTGTGPLTPTKGAPGRYSPSGIFGDATLATREKGEKVVEATVAGILAEIEALRQRRTQN
jgi:creatinine amidohydrolase